MEKYLRDDEPERLAEGRRLIAATMEEEKRKAKQKNISEAGSSSTASETSEVEGYDPENPGIPRAYLLSPIPETASETAVTPAEKSSEGIPSFSPQFVKAISTFHHVIEQSMKNPLFSPELITVASHFVGIEPSEKTDVTQGATSGAEPTEKAKEGEDKAAPIDLGEGSVPTKAATPHDEE